jgi:hypothetical protein
MQSLYNFLGENKTYQKAMATFVAILLLICIAKAGYDFGHWLKAL